MYLVKRGLKAGSRWVAHIWYGDYPKSRDGDTACRMASTGGLNVGKYLISPTPIHIGPRNGIKTELPICQMCQTNHEKRK